MTRNNFIAGENGCKLQYAEANTFYSSCFSMEIACRLLQNNDEKARPNDEANTTKTNSHETMFPLNIS